jgi:tetratricopeptide (TPR) repeat protein/transcriptional regulator with XRE-family HTH domain
MSSNSSGQPIEFTFAELLRGFRKRASLARADLAADLRVHLNTLAGWERGLYLPKTREPVIKLAEALALNPAETDQLLRAAEFPAAHGTPDPLTARHQLRASIADFVGRAREVEHVCAAVRAALKPGGGAIISSVQGMGGIGKTEFAYYVADEMRSLFPDAQLVLALQGSSPNPLAPEQVLQTVIHAFTPAAELPDDLPKLESLYRSLLHNQRVLILADDAGDAAQVRPLLPPPGCGLLITSRVRFTLPGMTTVALGQLDPREAVSLLRGICPRLKPAEARTIARLCGGLPLALRISGNLLYNDPALEVEAYLRRLADEQQRLAQLRDPDDPQLNVAASLALSAARLDEAARRVFRQLGVLVADFGTELALAVVDTPPGVEVLENLRLLLRRHLVMYDEEQQRWRLHDLVRDLARGALERTGEWEATCWRYARAAVQLAQALEDQYRQGGTGEPAALARFDAERPHIDAARQWAAAHAGTPEGDRLLLADVRATTSFGGLRYDWRRERIPQLERALAAAQRLGDRENEMKVLNRLGLARLFLGDSARALEHFTHQLTLAQALQDRASEALALNYLGVTHRRFGDFRRAIEFYEQSLKIKREIGDHSGEAASLVNLGVAHQSLGDARQALEYFEPALARFRKLGFRRGEGVVLQNLGEARLSLGDIQPAIAFFEQALALFRVLGASYDEGTVLYDLGRAHLAMGEAGLAIEILRRALALIREAGDQREEGYALQAIGESCAALGDRPNGRAAFAEALTLLRTVGDRSGEAECSWAFGLALSGWGEREDALPLLRAAVAYEQEIGHARTAEHAALLLRWEAGEAMPLSVRDRAGR